MKPIPPLQALRWLGKRAAKLALIGLLIMPSWIVPLLSTPAYASGTGTTIDVIKQCGGTTNPGRDLINALEATQNNQADSCSGLGSSNTTLSGPPYTLVLDPSYTYSFTGPYITGGSGNSNYNSYDAGPTALPNITTKVTIESSSTPPVTISRSGSAPFRFFDVVNTGKLTLRYIELTGGLALGGNGADMGGGGAGMGGAIFIHGGTVTLQNSNLVSNSAQGGTGAFGTAPGVGGGGGFGGSGGSGADNSNANSDGGGGGGGTFADGTSTTGSCSGAGGALNGGDGGPTNCGSVGEGPNGIWSGNGVNGGFGGGGGGGSWGSGGLFFGGYDGKGGSGGFGGGGGGGFSTGGMGGSGGFGGGGGGGGGSGGFGAGDGGRISGGGGGGFGGAIFSYGGSLTASNTSFSGNSAAGGGGTYADSGSGYGGAVFAYGGSDSGVATLSVTGSTFRGNTATATNSGTASVDRYGTVIGMPAIYTIDYHGNGNTGGNSPVDSNAYMQGQSATVLGNTGPLDKTGYIFAGWNTVADGSGTSYTAGNTITISANVTLYAQWVVSKSWTDITNGGSFNSPYGIAVDSAGDLFVINSGNNTVLERKSGSTEWTDITNGGSFNSPYGIAVDSAGDLFVTNAGNNTVLERKSGSAKWTNITDGGSFNYPQGIAVDSAGDLFVTNYDNNTVLERKHGSTTWADITNGGSFNGPSGIAVDGVGDLFVTNNDFWVTPTVLERKNGSAAWTDITNGGPFSNPGGIAVDSAGDLFVVDSQNNTVLERKSGSTSWTDITNGGPFSNPGGIAVDSVGDLFVANAGSNTVLEHVNPAFAVKVGLSAAPNSGLTANGTASSTITATVYDAAGNLVADGTPVIFGTNLGTLSATRITTTGGVAMVTLTSSKTAGTATVTAVSGTGAGTVAVAFVPGAAAKVSTSASPSSVTADGSTTSTVTVAVYDANGNLVADGTPVLFRTTGGSLSTTRAATIGGVAMVTLTSTMTAGTATVTAVSGTGSSTVTVAFVPGAAAKVITSASPSSVAADGRSTSTVTAAVYDAYGNLVANGTPVSFTTTCGTLSSPSTTTSGGVATVTLTSSTIAGTAQVTVTSGTGSSTVSVAFVPGAATKVTATASPSSVTADGSSTSTITAAVYDAYGNLVVNGTPVTFDTTAGTLSAPSVTTANGVAIVTLTSTVAGTATVTATSNGHSGAATVDFTAGAANRIILNGPGSPVTVGGTYTVTGTVYDQYGNPISGVSVHVGGQTVTTDGSGNYTSSLNAPNVLSSGRITVTAIGGGLSTSTTVILAAGAPAGISLLLPSTVFVGSPYTVAGQVYDLYSNPDGGVSVSVNGVSATTRPNGDFTVTLATPGSPGAETVTATVYGTPLIATGQVVISRVPVPTITTTLPAGTVGTSYSTTLSVTGGVGPYTWTSGTLPTGLTLNPSTGVIRGTPTVAGTTDFTVTATGSGIPTHQKVTANLTITVNPAALSITTTSLPSGTVGASYSATLSATGGVGPYTWERTGGSLPTGLSLIGNTIGGTPTAAGTSHFKVTVTDSVYNTVTANISITVASGSSSGGGGGGVVVVGGGGGGFSPPSTNPVTHDTATATIGVAGGTVATADHSVSLEIPPGAFTQNVTVTVQVGSASQTASAPQGDTAVSVVSIHTDGTEPLKPATITLSYNPSILDGLSPNRLGVYYENPSTGTWTWVGGGVDSSNDTITVTLPHFSTYAVLANTVQFTDMNQAAWAKPYVDTLLGAGIVNGVAPGVFDPKGTLTRAQFTKLLVLADGLPPVASGSTPFADVPAHTWFAPYVAAAEQAGLVDGTSATTFNPNAPITRQEMAVMLSRLLKNTTAASNPVPFSDASSISTWAESGVQQAVAGGLMKGFPNGTFEPEGISTRAQAAAVIARYLQSIGKA